MTGLFGRSSFCLREDRADAFVVRRLDQQHVIREFRKQTLVRRPFDVATESLRNLARCRRRRCGWSGLSGRTNARGRPPRLPTSPSMF